jgi:hypothetical protein
VLAPAASASADTVVATIPGVPSSGTIHNSVLSADGSRRLLLLAVGGLSLAARRLRQPRRAR